MAGHDGLSASQEDYLEAIIGLVQRRGAARVRDIAARLDVAKSSVTVALRGLRERELVNYTPYAKVTLTARGKELAGRIARRHEALASFFMNVLDMDESTAEANACRIEHAIGDGAMRRLQCFTRFMAISEAPAKDVPQAFREQCTVRRDQGLCPECHGASASAPREGVPASTENTMQQTTLADLKPGERAKVVRVSGAAAAGGRMMDMGLTRGATITVRRVAPFGDPIEIDVRGYNLSLRKNEAKAVAVEKVNDAP